MGRTIGSLLIMAGVYAIGYVAGTPDDQTGWALFGGLSLGTGLGIYKDAD